MQDLLVHNYTSLISNIMGFPIVFFALYWVEMENYAIYFPTSPTYYPAHSSYFQVLKRNVGLALRKNKTWILQKSLLVSCINNNNYSVVTENQTEVNMISYTESTEWLMLCMTCFLNWVEFDSMYYILQWHWLKMFYTVMSCFFFTQFNNTQQFREWSRSVPLCVITGQFPIRCTM